jgi:hypothetical protein
VSLRTLWTNFKDLEGLYAAANVRLIELQNEATVRSGDRPAAETHPGVLRAAGPAAGDVGPAARASQLGCRTRPSCAATARCTTPQLRRVRPVFPTELAAAEDRERVVRALLVNTSSAAWSLLRDELGLDQDTATAVMTRSVAALLEPAAEN